MKPGDLVAELRRRRGMAKAQGVSVNQFLATLIAERVREVKALSHIRLPIARADLTQAGVVLALIPDRTATNCLSDE